MVVILALQMRQIWCWYHTMTSEDVTGGTGISALEQANAPASVLNFGADLRPF